MSSHGTSIASYATSALLFIKGLCVSAASAFASMPTEGKIGALLGVGTFLINWYYKRKSLEVLTRRAPQREPDDAD
jgi:hypothetical protein